SVELATSGPDSVVDLDLDLDTPGPVSVPPMTAPEITQPFSAPSAPAPQPAPADLNFELPPIAPVASPPAQPAPMDFDLDGLSLDLDVPATVSPAAPAAAPGRRSGLPGVAEPAWRAHSAGCAGARAIAVCRRTRAHDLRRAHRCRCARPEPGRALRCAGRTRGVLVGARDQSLSAERHRAAVVPL